MIRFLIATLLLASSFANADSVTIRGEGGKTYQGVISSGSFDGLRFTIDGSGEGTTLFPWSEVASFTATRPRPALAKFHEDGEKLWRARNRLERGDLLLAEPIFEHICESDTLRNSYDARVAYEGLLRCLIARGKIKEAILPWLSTAKLEEFGIASPYTNLQPIIDTDTLLCPHLPPVWLNDNSLLKMLETSLASDTPKLNALTKELLSLIDNNAESQANNLDTFVKTTLKETSGTKPWLTLWERWFSAMNILQQDDSDKRDEALLQLAVIASSGKAHQPWLACAAMYRLSDELQLDGKLESASLILDDAKRSFPSHPIHHNDEFKIRNVSK